MSDFLTWLGDRSWLGWVALIVGGLGAGASVLPGVLRRVRDQQGAASRGEQ